MGKRVHRRNIRFLAGSLGLSVLRGAGLAQSSSYIDLRIGDPNVTYLDPEFWPAGQMMLWQEQFNGQVWVCQVNPEDGTMIPPDGKGQPMGFAAPITQTYNGPEFGLSQQGLSVFYTGVSPNATLQLYRSRVQPGALPEQLTFERSDQVNNIGVISSLDASESQTRLIYFKGRTALPATIYWMYENRQSDEVEIGTPGTVTLAGPRWMPGELKFVTNQHIDRYAQIIFADALSGARTQLSFDNGDKSDPFAWRAPEFNNEMLIMATLDNDSLAVYRQINGAWTRINVASVPGVGRHYSGEPFVYRGRSYATVAVETADPNNKEIWVVGLTPLNPFALRCHDQRPLLRVDPESLVFQDRVFVSYYNYPAPGVPNELHAVRVNLPPFPAPIRDD